MKKIMISLALMGSILGLSGCCGGSKEHSAATSYCRLNKSDDSCKTCCTNQKAVSSQFSGGSCRCYK